MQQSSVTAAILVPDIVLISGDGGTAVTQPVSPPQLQHELRPQLDITGQSGANELRPQPDVVSQSAADFIASLTGLYHIDI